MSWCADFEFRNDMSATDLMRFVGRGAKDAHKRGRAVQEATVRPVLEALHQLRRQHWQHRAGMQLRRRVRINRERPAEALSLHQSH